jgi:hypothetical protein
MDYNKEISASPRLCGSGLLFQPQNAPVNAVTQQRDIEVDKQAHFPTTQAQVGKGCRRQVVDSLELYNHRVRNNQVHAVSTIPTTREIVSVWFATVTEP